MWLDALRARGVAFRYHRCARCPACAVCPGSEWPKHRAALTWAIGRRLLDGAAFEAALPRVVRAVAETDAAGHRFRVHANVTGSAAAGQLTTRLWWNSSPDRVYNAPDQPKWASVAMAGDGGDGGGVSSSWVEVPAGHEGAWFVETAGSLAMLKGGPHKVPVDDASDIAFVFRTDATKRHCSRL